MCYNQSIDIVTHHDMEKKEVSRFSEWALEELEAERDRLRHTLEEVEEALLDRLGFAKAVPVRELRHGGRLIDALKSDSRPIVIYIAGTKYHCILRPATQDDLPRRSVSIGRLSQECSKLTRQAHRGQRIGIRRGGARTHKIVAELYPPNRFSELYCDILVKSEKIKDGTSAME